MIGTGVLEITLEKNDDSVSVIASSTHYRASAHEVQHVSCLSSRYEPFCDLMNSFIGMVACKCAIFTRSGPSLGRLYASGGLSPEVAALPSTLPTENGPLQAFGTTWALWHCLIPVEFKKQRNTLIPEIEYVSHLERARCQLA